VTGRFSFPSAPCAGADRSARERGKAGRPVRLVDRPPVSAGPTSVDARSSGASSSMRSDRASATSSVGSSSAPPSCEQVFSGVASRCSPGRPLAGSLLPRRLLAGRLLSPRGLLPPGGGLLLHGDPRPPGLGEPDRDRLLARPRSPLPVLALVRLLVDELARSGTRALPAPASLLRLPCRGCFRHVLKECKSFARSHSAPRDSAPFDAEVLIRAATANLALLVLNPRERRAAPPRDQAMPAARSPTSGASGPRPRIVPARDDAPRPARPVRTDGRGPPVPVLAPA
jgi:hypothetical protein